MRPIALLAALIALLIAGYTAAWFWAAGAARDYVAMLGAGDGVASPRVTCQALDLSGFPFGFDATCTNARLQSGDVTISLPALKASALVYRPTHLLAFAQGPIDFEDALWGSRSRLDFTKAEGSVRLVGWRIGRASLVVEAPAWADTLVAPRLLAKAANLEAHLVDIPEKYDAANGRATLGAHLALTGAEIPGPAIAGGALTLEAEIANLPDDIRTYGDLDILRRWQAADGRLTLAQLAAHDPASRIDATGTLRLDDLGRIDGDLHLTSRGVIARINQALNMPMLTLLAGQPAEDGTYTHALHFSAGALSLGLIPLPVIVPPLF